MSFKGDASSYRENNTKEFGLTVMKREEVKEAIECLDGERRVFHYFKDRYCLDRLDYEMHKQGLKHLSIKALKNSPLSGYLQKPLFKENASLFGSGFISNADLALLKPATATAFILEVAAWGEAERGWDQTTRNDCNLVLRLNFNESMNRLYRQLVKPAGLYGPFESWCHPVSKSQRKTLSWVRMDMDFATNEVLIEEIQNDWLRRAQSSLHYVRKKLANEPAAKPSAFIHDIGGTLEALEEYVEQVLKPYQKIWAEASMSAAIHFIRTELGIDEIFYHTFDTGTKIKKVTRKPPRSMYTNLPKQFGFEVVPQAPKFIAHDKKARRYLKAIKDSCWFKLD